MPEQLASSPYDALLLLSFGGPEGPDDVVPFLENVTRGRGIPKERLKEVGQHYFLFGGVSPARLIAGLCITAFTFLSLGALSIFYSVTSRTVE